MEDSRVSKAKKGMPSSEQGESDVDSFLRSRRRLHHEYTPEGPTVNKKYYVDILRQLHDVVQ
jgi:hypothetical protein